MTGPFCEDCGKKGEVTECGECEMLLCDDCLDEHNQGGCPDEPDVG